MAPVRLAEPAKELLLLMSAAKKFSALMFMHGLPLSCTFSLNVSTEISHSS